MFLSVSVILFTGGGSAQLQAGIHPPPRTRGRHPLREQTPAPRTRHPQEQTPPGSRHPPAQYMLEDMGNKRAVRILMEMESCLKLIVHFFIQQEKYTPPTVSVSPGGRYVMVPNNPTRVSGASYSTVVCFSTDATPAGVLL